MSAGPRGSTGVVCVQWWGCIMIYYRFYCLLTAFKTVIQRSQMVPYIDLERKHSVLSQDSHRILFEPKRQQSKEIKHKKCNTSGFQT